jgi:putative spermidine/putrescine transport system substrate-binding protein
MTPASHERCRSARTCTTTRHWSRADLDSKGGTQVHTTRLLKAAALCSAVALLAACGSSATSGSTASAPPSASAFAGPVGAGEGKLSLLVWPGYAEEGKTDPKVDWVTPFTKATGCAVTVQTFGTSDESFKQFQTGQYDLISASGDASRRLIFGGFVQPVNTDLVPNYADIVADLKDQTYNTVNGVHYGIPHGRGANLLAYNTTKVTPAPTSWGAVFDAASPYKGKITAYDNAIYLADAALYLMKTKPDLKITNPYALDTTQLAAAKDLIAAQKPLVGEYWSDAFKQIDSFKSGASLLGTTWQYQINSLPGVINGIKPTEGSTGWSDTWMVKKDTPNINCAYKWLDWIVSPQINAQVAEWFGEAPSNAKACDYTADKNWCTAYHTTDTEYWKDVYYWNTPTADCLDGRTDTQCTTYKDWVAAWTEARGA